MWAVQRAARPLELLCDSQQTHPTTAFPGMGMQRESKGRLIALLVGLGHVGRSQVWEQMFAELRAKHCYLPLLQITALLTDTSAKAWWATLLPGLRQPFQHGKVEC